MNDYNRACLAKLDLRKNGLFEQTQAATEQNRKGDFSLSLCDSSGRPLRGARVSVKQIKHDFRFGSTAFLADVIQDDAARELYESRFARLFNQAVLAFYWRDDEPEQGKLRFEKGSPFIYRRPPADEALEFCRRVGAEPKGHNMLWQDKFIGIPDWFPDDKAEAMRLIEKRVRILAERYADKIPVWDVTNECTVAPGVERMPPDYDTNTWRLANELFKNHHLILNDYNSYFGNYHGPMSAVYLQAQKLMLQGIHIDGIGIQYHLFRKEEELPKIAQSGNMLDARHMNEMLDVYATLGKDLHISEITVPSYNCSAPMLDMQAKVVENLYRIWFAHGAVSSIVWWNLADGFAFSNQNQNEDYYAGGLLTHDFAKKPSYEVLEELICHEWSTQTQIRCDESGAAQFRGFFGDYELEIEAECGTVKKTVSLTKASPACTITLNR